MTPVDVTTYKELLEKYKYDPEKTHYLVHGFTHGFDIHYEGPNDTQRMAKTLRFRIGNKTDLWNKIMKWKQKE